MGTPAQRAQAAFAQRSWAQVHDLLADCDGTDPADHERLAVAAYLLGREADSARAWERAHRLGRDAGDAAGAGRCAFWLGFQLLLAGQEAQALGWLGRAARQVADAGPDCATAGLLLVPEFLQALGRGAPQEARALADRMVQIAKRCADPDVEAFGLLCLGEVLLATGEVRAGARAFDEAMVPVSTGEVSPITAGIVYCAVIDACVRVCDLGRAREWTTALGVWCDAQPDLVPYRGQCLVHRSQVLLAHGDWDVALREAELAEARLCDPPHPALGAALYQLAELARLRGEFAAAETGYRAADEHGYEPAPGLALLRLAEGDTAAAQVTVTRMLAGTHPGPAQAPVLAAAVEIFLAAGEPEQAAQAADRLAAAAAPGEIPVISALHAHARGVLTLADGKPAEAVGPLRAAIGAWRRLDMPYDLARSRVHLGLAFRALGDPDSAERELAGARDAFRRLGATPDLDRVLLLIEAPGSRADAVLTGREREVLRLVAAGRTNRGIAEELGISEHTVARHLQNVFVKLDVPSRAAATAYAYQHDLL